MIHHSLHDKRAIAQDAEETTIWIGKTQPKDRANENNCRFFERGSTFWDCSLHVVRRWAKHIAREFGILSFHIDLICKKKKTLAGQLKNFSQAHFEPWIWRWRWTATSNRSCCDEHVISSCWPEQLHNILSDVFIHKYYTRCQTKLKNFGVRDVW